MIRYNKDIINYIFDSIGNLKLMLRKKNRVKIIVIQLQ